MLTRTQIKKYFSALLIGATVNLFLPYTLVIAETGRPLSTILNVPFVMQAPGGNWSDPRLRDGCEEASILMALAWARGGDMPAEEALRNIIDLSEYERVMYGYYQDTSIEDTAKLMREYYGYDKVEIIQNINSENIKQELAQNHLVIIPINTRLTKLKIYRKGPVRHTVVAVGYDDHNDTIIIHDPEYGRGAYKAIPARALDRALSDYWSGNHLRDTNPGKAMMVVSR